MEFVEKLEEKPINLLLNVRNVEVSKESQLRFAGAAKQVKEYCAKIAVVGVTPVIQVIINAINKVTGIGARAFKLELEAKEWLIAPEKSPEDKD